MPPTSAIMKNSRIHAYAAMQAPARLHSGRTPCRTKTPQSVSTCSTSFRLAAWGRLAEWGASVAENWAMGLWQSVAWPLPSHQRLKRPPTPPPPPPPPPPLGLPASMNCEDFKDNKCLRSSECQSTTCHQRNRRQWEVSGDD